VPIKTNLKDLQPRREKYKQVITLLSRGFTDPKAWPGGKLTVYPWDSQVDTWLMEEYRRSSDSKAGLLHRALTKVCDLNGGSSDNFVASEVETVLLVSRAIRNANVVEYTSPCPACRWENISTISIPDELEKVGTKSSDYPGYDIITLPDSKDEVAMRPLLIKDEKFIETRTVEDREAVSDDVLYTILPIITVGGGKPETKEEIVQWYLALSPDDAKYLEEQQKQLTPHLNTLIPHECDKCKHPYKHKLSFDQEFFRPRGDVRQ